MRILVLRAAQDAARTAKELQSRRHKPVVSPLIEFVPTKAPLPEGSFDALIATSAQALNHMDTIDVLGLRPLPFLCVGTRPGLAGLKLGLAAPKLVGTDAASLLRLISEKFKAGTHFLYLAGEDRKPDLEEGLAAGGYQLTLHESYRADAADKMTIAGRSALEHDEIDVILHYSRRSVEIFLGFVQLHKFDLSTTIHLCLSEDVATPLRAASFENIAVADTPNENGLFEKLARI